MFFQHRLAAMSACALLAACGGEGESVRFDAPLLSVSVTKSSAGVTAKAEHTPRACRAKVVRYGSCDLIRCRVTNECSVVVLQRTTLTDLDRPRCFR